MRKYTQEEAEKLFLSKGFKLLDNYISNSNKQKVKCLKCRNIVFTSLSSCKCHLCNANNCDKIKLAKEDFKKTCSKANVTYIYYKNANDKKWKCPKCGNVFKTWPTKCKTCIIKQRIKNSYKNLEKNVLKNGDTLLTEFSEYKGITNNIKIRYSCGHLGTPKGNNYLINPRCNVCARKKVGKLKRISIKYIKRNCRIANVTITSKFISTGKSGYYKGICNKCGNEVIIKSAKYCIPRCTKCNPTTIQEPIVETLLRKWLIRKTKEKWKKIRPKWLPSPSCDGYFLELDMYCKKLKMAIEYQGPHHYIKNVGIFGLGKKQILKIIKHDFIKKEICEKRKIRLLVIDGTKYNTFKKAKKFITKWLLREGITI